MLLPVAFEDRDLEWVGVRHKVCQNKL